MSRDTLYCKCGKAVGLIRLNGRTLRLAHDQRDVKHSVRLARPSADALPGVHRPTIREPDRGQTRRGAPGTLPPDLSAPPVAVQSPALGRADVEAAYPSGVSAHASAPGTGTRHRRG
jgi:hypothetical protein